MSKKSAAEPVPHDRPDDAAATPEVIAAGRRALMGRRASGSMKGRISLSLEEALAPLDARELKAWGGD